MITLQETLNFAIKAHENADSKDKGTGAPYYLHLVRVMLRLGEDATLEEKQAAILHDVLEDTTITEEDLRKFGFSENVIEAVKLCSNIYYKDKTFTEWLETIGNSRNRMAQKVKIADIFDNFSQERLYGLYKKSQFSKEVLLVNTLLSKKIMDLISVKMKLSGEMGIFTRYIKGLNILFNLVPEVFDPIIKDGTMSKDFLYKMKDYLRKEDMENYAESTNLNGLSEKLKLEVILDKNGQEYLAIDIKDYNLMQSYQLFLMDKFDDSEQFIENKNNRDRNKFHITVLSAAEYGKIKKENRLEEVKTFLNEEFTVSLYGIGQAKDKKDNVSYFIVASSGFVDQFRSKLGFGKKDLHITLGFKEKDVFGVSKGLDSIIYDFQKIWKESISSIGLDGKEKIISLKKMNI